jgi:hypothetical protein
LKASFKGLFYLIYRMKYFKIIISFQLVRPAGSEHEIHEAIKYYQGSRRLTAIEGSKLFYEGNHFVLNPNLYNPQLITVEEISLQEYNNVHTSDILDY